jgi:hypothetical protein
VEVGTTVVGTELDVSALARVVVTPPLAMVGPVGAGTNDPATVLDGLDELAGFDELDGLVELGVADDVEAPGTVVVETSDDATEPTPVDVICALTVPATPRTAPLTKTPTTPRHALVNREVNRKDCCVLASGLGWARRIGVLLIGASFKRLVDLPTRYASQRETGGNCLYSCRCLPFSCGFSSETLSRNKPLT